MPCDCGAQENSLPFRATCTWSTKKRTWSTKAFSHGTTEVRFADARVSICGRPSFDSQTSEFRFADVQATFAACLWEGVRGRCCHFGIGELLPRRESTFQAGLIGHSRLAGEAHRRSQPNWPRKLLGSSLLTFHGDLQVRIRGGALKARRFFFAFINKKRLSGPSQGSGLWLPLGPLL